MSRHVALLRSINVGGTKKVPMAELRALCSGLGWRAVRTYIASGNVIFTPPEGAPREALGPALEAAVRDHFGFEVPVLLRTVEELRAAWADNPFAGEAFEEKLLHVVFLDAVPEPGRVAALDRERSPPDRLAVRGDRVVVRYASSSARSKITLPWLERELGVRGTARNWRTLGKLIALAGAD